VTLPLAHVGHYLWTLYLLPVLIIIGGIVKTQLAAKKRQPPATPSPPTSGEKEPL